MVSVGCQSVVSRSCESVVLVGRVSRSCQLMPSVGVVSRLFCLAFGREVVSHECQMWVSVGRVSRSFFELVMSVGGVKRSCLLVVSVGNISRWSQSALGIVGAVFLFHSKV